MGYLRAPKRCGTRVACVLPPPTWCTASNSSFRRGFSLFNGLAARMRRGGGRFLWGTETDCQLIAIKPQSEPNGGLIVVVGTVATIQRDLIIALAARAESRITAVPSATRHRVPALSQRSPRCADHALRCGNEIYSFGFSRGAYTARSFTGLLSNCGILDRRTAARAKETIELPHPRGHARVFRHEEGSRDLQRASSALGRRRPMMQTGSRSWSRETGLRFMCCPRVIIQGVCFAPALWNKIS
jgi:hypothetical protein